jgi:hypothetical protein
MTEGSVAEALGVNVEKVQQSIHQQGIKPIHLKHLHPPDVTPEFRESQVKDPHIISELFIPSLNQRWKLLLDASDDNSLCVFAGKECKPEKIYWANELEFLES